MCDGLGWRVEGCVSGLLGFLVFGFLGKEEEEEEEEEMEEDIARWDDLGEMWMGFCRAA